MLAAMNGTMRLILLLLSLMITRSIQQSESANCTLENYNYTYQNDSGIEMAELSFQGLDGASCNLSITAIESIDQCLEDIEIVNNSCLFNRSSVSCMNQTVERTKTVTTSIIHTQKVYSQTTLSICPTPTLLLYKDTHLIMTSIVYITRGLTSTPSTKTVLSNVAQIGILATSAVLICLPISVLVIVTYCWIRTYQIMKKTRNEVKFDHSVQDSIPSRCQNISEAATLNLNNNPAYEAQTPLQRNIAYEDTTLTTSKPQPKESQTLTSTQELAYEIVPLISCQSASTTTHVLENREGDEHKKLNRDLFQQK